MAKVELKHIFKQYEGVDTPSVSDANITIEDREFVVLVGPSGCGKSTTLRMIAGLESISKGELIIDGKLVNDMAPKDRDIAMVFQSYALYPHMTVYENMAFGLRLRKFSKDEIEKRVREAAKILDIEDYLQRKPKALSGGQRQRVAVGRAIVRQPKVFLFDEPLSNLDAKLRVQMRAEIISLHRRLDATMVYVTHDQVEAMTMGDKIVVMKDGFVQQIGAPLELYNNPVNRFVAGFIGSPPMNFIPVDLAKKDGDLVMSNHLFNIKLPAALKPKLEAYAGKPLILGIRPEDIYDTEDTQPSASALFPVDIAILEPLGPETYVHFQSQDIAFMAKFKSTTSAGAGEKGRKISFNLDRIHFFDPADQEQKALL